MAASDGIRSRLRSHKKSESKIWFDFSIFEVWYNIRENEVEELEGLSRDLQKRHKGESI
jgi:hypothetical protein